MVIHRDQVGKGSRGFRGSIDRYMFEQSYSIPSNVRSHTQQANPSGQPRLAQSRFKHNLCPIRLLYFARDLVPLFAYTHIIHIKYICISRLFKPRFSQQKVLLSFNKLCYNLSNLDVSNLLKLVLQLRRENVMIHS